MFKTQNDFQCFMTAGGYLESDRDFLRQVPHGIALGRCYHVFLSAGDSRSALDKEASMPDPSNGSGVHPV